MEIFIMLLTIFDHGWKIYNGINHIYIYITSHFMSPTSELKKKN